MEPILLEIERAFKSLNKSLFGGQLTAPMFCLCPYNKGVIRFVPKTGQMEVGGDLTLVDAVAFLLHLLHEMVHVSNYQKGILDCRIGQYHKTQFRDAALAVGLTVCRRRSNGWGITSLDTGCGDSVMRREPTEVARKLREQAFDDVGLKIEILQSLTTIAPVRRRSFFLKYECNCPGPHNSIRSGRRPDGEHPLRIKCMDCGSYFHCVDLP